MVRQRLGWTGLALAGALGWMGCSLNTFDYTPCQSHSICESALGAGFRCVEGYCAPPGDERFCAQDQECADFTRLGGVCEEGVCAPPVVPDRCRQTFPADFFQDLSATSPYADHIVLGVVLSFQNDAVERRAIETAVRQMNERGGADGRRFALVSCNHDEGGLTGGIDALSEREAAESTTRFLADTLRVPVIFGAIGSDPTENILEASRRSGALVVTPGAGSPSLTDLARDGQSRFTTENPGRIWRTVPTDGVQAAALLELFEDAGYSEVAVIRQDGTYARELDRLLRNRQAEQSPGLTLLPARVFDSANNEERRSAIAAAGESDADAILFLSGDTADAIRFLSEAASRDNLGGRPLYLTDSAYRRAILNDVSGFASVLDQVRGTRLAPAEGSARFEDFRRAYRGYFPTGTDPAASAFSATAHDAAWLVLYGVLWTLVEGRELQGIQIARGMRLLAGESAEPVELSVAEYATLRNRLAAGNPTAVRGLGGILRFDLDRQELASENAEIEVWTLSSDSGACPEGSPGACFVAVDRLIPLPAE